MRTEIEMNVAFGEFTKSHGLPPLNIVNKNGRISIAIDYDITILGVVNSAELEIKEDNISLLFEASKRVVQENLTDLKTFFRLKAKLKSFYDKGFYARCEQYTEVETDNPLFVHLVFKGNKLINLETTDGEFTVEEIVHCNKALVNILAGIDKLKKKLKVFKATREKHDKILTKLEEKYSC